MTRIAHMKLKAWIDETADLGEPDQVYWVDGSQEERSRLTKRAIARGFVIPLDQERYPGVKSFFDQFGAALPEELWKQLGALRERLRTKVPA